MSSQLCEQCHNKDKKIRILQADIDFEIKKMNEDLAQEKVLLELQYQKQNKKINQKYMKEKQERDAENRKWLMKYDKMVQQYEDKIEQLHKQYQASSDSIKEQIERQFSRKEEKRIEQHENEVSALKSEHQSIVISMEQSQSREVKSLKDHEEKAIRELQKNQDKKVNDIVAQYEVKVNSLKKQIANITENRDCLQKQASKKQASLFEELYQRRQEIASLKYQIDHLNNTIKNCEEEIQNKNIQIQCLKQKYEKSIQRAKEEYEYEKLKIIGDHNTQIEHILLKKLEDYHKFEENVKEIQIKRQNEAKFFEDSLKQVKVLVEERPSRDEDMEKIKILKDMINQKDRQYEKVLEVAKNYRLELDYKEQTFNRIFPANPNPLNIERIGLRKEKSNKGSQSHLKDTIKYSTTKTIHTHQDLGKDRGRMTGTTLKLF